MHALLSHYFLPWLSFRIFWQCSRCDSYKFQVLTTACKSVSCGWGLCHHLHPFHFARIPVPPDFHPCLLPFYVEKGLESFSPEFCLAGAGCSLAKTLSPILPQVSTHPSFTFALNAAPWLIFPPGVVSKSVFPVTFVMVSVQHIHKSAHIQEWDP